VEEESWLEAAASEALIVRAAAIYGPGRGIHVRVREGRLPRAEPGGITSRIHADDLAAILEAGALSDLAGAWPVADDHPCPTAEVAQWCSRILSTPLQAPWSDAATIAGRRVDGRKIRDLLGVRLSYPDYQSGILASLAEEACF
jgi:nucleoside-diphosphate-sugar epimerase